MDPVAAERARGAPDSPTSRAIAGVTYALLAGFALAIILHFRAHDFPYAHDDAYISYRYALNFAGGHGLVFNPGERVWGFTSPLQTVMLGLVGLLGFDIPSASFGLAIVWISLGAALVFLLTRPYLPAPLGALVALYFASHGVGYEFLGLESNLLVALQCLFLLLVTRRRYAAAALVGSLSCLTRPDSLLLVGPILLLERGARTPRNLALFAAPGVAWLLFAWGYYGDFVPNSFHAKRALTPFAEFLASAFRWITALPLSGELAGAGPRDSWPWPGRAALLVLSLGVLADPRFRRSRALVYGLLVYPWLLVLAYAWIGAPVGHTWEIYSAYFLQRLAVVLGAFVLLRRLAEPLRLDARRGRVALACLAAPLLLFWVSLLALNAKRCFDYLEINRSSFWGGARHETYLEIAGWIDENLPPGSTLAVMEVGTIGYHTDLHLIDTSGIVTRGYRPDERLSHRKMARRFRPDYLLTNGYRRALEIDPSLRYELLHYFPKQRYFDFSLLKKR